MAEGPKRRLSRLDQIYVHSPIYFLTTNIERRLPVLACGQAASILVEEWSGAWERHGWGVGAYVIMPDHVHFFAGSALDAVELSRFMQAWKEWTSKRILKALGMTAPLWQPGFFDHVMRSSESYEQKGRYVQENPVRAGLVTDAKDWPWQGVLGVLRGPSEDGWQKNGAPPRPTVAATD